MKKRIIIFIISMLIFVACKMNIDVTTPPAQPVNVPANTTSGVKSYAEIKVDLPDSVKDTDGSIELKSFIISYSLTNLSSDFALTNNDVIISLVGEATKDIKLYNDPPKPPLCLRNNTYSEGKDYVYMIKNVDIGIGERKDYPLVKIPDEFVNKILKQGYVYIDAKISLSWGWSVPTSTQLSNTKLGIRNLKMRINVDKETGSFLIFENIL